MNFKGETSKLRFEIKNGLAYVRCVETGKVITALTSERKEKKIVSVLMGIKNESFSQVWDMMNSIKGVSFEYQSY